ncbi:MAG: Rad52/Rad22 family DNA repair protein [Bryobacteraceae bacterium]
MAYMNGATESATAPPLATAPNVETNTHGGEQFPPERLKVIQGQLAEPFDPGEIKWRVTATSTQQGKHGPQKRGQVVAYPDQRAYTDRLNEVFGEWGWTRNYEVSVAQNFERRASGDKTQKAVSAKVVVVSKVTVHGLGSHTGVGEEWADNDNAATAAEAQAFKRACSVFGLGRYLYDVPAVWVDLDQYNRPLQTPNVPDWALPSYAQRQQQAEKKERGRQNAPRQSIVREETLAMVRALCNKVGYSLSQTVLKTYLGTNDLANLSELGFARLTNLMERLNDIANGINRLGKAAEVVGPSRYEAICKELNFASDSIDDIPDRNALRVLLTRVEVEAAAKQKSTDPGANGTATIAEARGRLLQAARKAAENRRSGWPASLGEVIARASEGKLSLDGLKDLSDADVPLIQAATTKIEGGVH